MLEDKMGDDGEVVQTSNICFLSIVVDANRKPYKPFIFFSRPNLHLLDAS
jgi:hypothetical protein